MSPATWASVQEWVGPFSFRYERQDTDSDGRVGFAETKRESGQAAFTRYHESAYPNLVYHGTAQAQGSYNAVSTGSVVECTLWKKWAHGTGTPTTFLSLTFGNYHTYNWYVNGFRVRQSGTRTHCGKPARHTGIDAYTLVYNIPLPSTLVLCGTLNDTQGGRGGASERLSGSWAFYPKGHLPKGQILNTLPTWCAHMLEGTWHEGKWTK